MAEADEIKIGAVGLLGMRSDMVKVLKAPPFSMDEELAVEAAIEMAKIWITNLQIKVVTDPADSAKVRDPRVLRGFAEGFMDAGGWDPDVAANPREALRRRQGKSIAQQSEELGRQTLDLPPEHEVIEVEEKESDELGPIGKILEAAKDDHAD